MTTRTASRRRKEDCERDCQQQRQSKLDAEITVFIKFGGPLTKRISLTADGSIKSDGIACIMARGDARRVEIGSVDQLAGLIEQLPPNQAIALGALRTGLPDKVKVVTKAKLLNGAAQPNIIARTGNDIIYRKGQPAFALLDYDTKGMPDDIAAELKRRGGFWEALVSVLPALRDVARVVRRSTSAGLSRSDTGEQLAGSDGLHVYLLVKDSTDIERFLKALHERCWLAGLGWMMVGAAGQLLERAPERAKAHAAFVERQAKRIIERTSMPMRAATRIVVRQCEGILLPSVELSFDDEEFAGSTVADILNDPDHFEGATLADPLEGVEYGRCKAKVMRRPDGTPWIHSFAHGRTIYQLRFDASAVRAAIEQADNDAAVRTFIEFAVAAELDDQELEELRNLAAARNGINKRTITGMLKGAQRQHAEQHAELERKRHVAERSDPRPLIEIPAIDAPWLPQMDVLNEALAADKPPTRDIDDVIAQVRKLPVPNTHAFTQTHSNTEE
jgi:hypothetical protein